MGMDEHERYVMQRMLGWRRNWRRDFEETTGMVSNSLDMELQELLDMLGRLQRDCREDPEYRELRRALPEEWPL
jgi:hypothetical protein